MHTVRLKLETDKEQRDMLERSFHALSHIHNVLVAHVRKLLCQLEHNHEYQDMREAYIDLLGRKKLSREEECQKKALSSGMKGIRESLGLSEYALQAYIKVCAKQFKQLLSSQQIQKEATRVYRSAQAYLFKNGKSVHFKKYRDFSSIEGKSPQNGAVFDPESFTVRMNGQTISVKLPKDADSAEYICEALNDSISYCTISRLMFPNGWHYYVIITLKGDAPKKLIPGNRTIGIDPGVSTIAAVADDEAWLEELAPRTHAYAKKLSDIQRRMDASKRASNPSHYNADGTVNRQCREPWVFSKNYLKLRDLYKYLHGCKSRYIKCSHGALANRIIEAGTDIIAEKMNWQGLARRSKKQTETTDKTMEVTDSAGNRKQIRKCRRKKRFGKSLSSRSPGLFMSILEKKASFYGGSVRYIDTAKFRASQYCHDTGKYVKVPLSQRSKQIAGIAVQRDLYSAFLIRHADASLKKPDRDMCSAMYFSFTGVQDMLIARMQSTNISMPQCFGF